MQTATWHNGGMQDWGAGEKRSEPRFPTSEPATVDFISSPHPLAGCVINISHSGLKVALEEPIGVGILIQVTMKNLSLIGEVRYCIPAEGRFYAGVCVHEARLVPPHQREAIPV